MTDKIIIFIMKFNSQTIKNNSFYINNFSSLIMVHFKIDDIIYVQYRHPTIIIAMWQKT